MTIGIIVNSMHFADSVMEEARRRLTNIDHINFKDGRIITKNRTEVVVTGDNSFKSSFYVFDELFFSSEVRYWRALEIRSRMRTGGKEHYISNDMDTIVNKIGEF